MDIPVQNQSQTSDMAINQPYPGPSVAINDNSAKEKIGGININISSPANPTQSAPAPPPYQQQVQYQPQPQVQYQPQPQVQYQPQPQVQYQPQPQYQHQVIVTQPQMQAGIAFLQQQPVILSSDNLGDVPTVTTCKNCRQRVSTRVIYKAGALAWLICIGCLLLGLWCGCCIIPFFMESLMDAYHSCPECNSHLHVHKRM